MTFFKAKLNKSKGKPTTMVKNITNYNGQQYHQTQWSTISPTTIVNNITKYNGQQYHQTQW
jgi:hypothetical protein